MSWDGWLVIADPAQKQERQDLLVEANVVTVPAITDVRLGINQVNKTLEPGPDGLPMTVMISNGMAHMTDQFANDAHPLTPAQTRDQFPSSGLPRRGLAVSPTFP